MNFKGVTIMQSKLFLLSSIIIFIAAEAIAEITQLWLLGNPSISALTTYNGMLGNIPQALSVGASTLLPSGLAYQPKRRVIAMVAVGLVLMAFSLVLTHLSILSTTVEYYPGFYLTVASAPLSNLSIVGLGITLGGIVSLAFRDMLIRKEGVGA